MKLRLLALGLALASQWPAARAESFLEVVQASAQRDTLAGTAVIGAGHRYTVGSLQLSVDDGQAAFIAYTYLGGESSARHRFYGPDAASMIDSRATPGTQITTRVAAGLLDFSFGQSDSSRLYGAANHAWQASNIGIVLDDNRRGGWLLLEDGLGTRGPDLDYDDMVMRFDLHVAPVPEPGNIALMLAGLGLLGTWIGRRDRTRA